MIPGLTLFCGFQVSLPRVLIVFLAHGDCWLASSGAALQGVESVSSRTSVRNYGNIRLQAQAAGRFCQNGALNTKHSTHSLLDNQEAIFKACWFVFLAHSVGKALHTSYWQPRCC